jgi:hypothetical protein
VSTESLPVDMPQHYQKLPVCASGTATRKCCSTPETNFNYRRSETSPSKPPSRPATGNGCSAGLQSLWVVWGSAAFDWDIDEVAPFGPGAIVVARLFDAEQFVQDKPGVGRAFADAAVADHWLAVQYAVGVVQFV